MIPDGDPVAEAVTVLTSRRHSVEPDDFENWRVDGGDWLSAGDLLAWSIMLGLNGLVGRLQ